MKKIYMLLIVVFLTVLVGCKDNKKINIEEDISKEDAVETVKDEEKDEEAIEIENKSLVELIDKKVNELLGDSKDNVSIYFKNLNKLP